MQKFLDLNRLPAEEHKKQFSELLKLDDFTPSQSERARRLLLEHPEIRNQFESLAAFSLENNIRSVSGQAMEREAFMLGTDELRKSLERAGDTALEKLLIEQCINSYVLYYCVEFHYTEAGRRNLNFAYYWETRVNAAQRRFLRALETLSRIRRTATPVQINIAETQTNISTNAPPPAADADES